jgi:CHAT domain-containing protein/tetratricopeptide (TPR) repeat protein
MIVFIGFCYARGQESSGEAELRLAAEFKSKALYDNSIAHFKAAEAIYRTSSRRDLHYRCIAGIADDLLRKTDFHSADSMLTGELDAVRTELGEDHEETAEFYGLLGYLRTYQDRFGEAKVFYGRAFATCERIFGRNAPRVAANFYGLGLTYERSGDFDSALVCLLKARTIQEGMGDSGQVGLANTLATIGSVYDLRSEPTKAIEAFTQASTILEKAGLGSSPSAGYCFHFLAVCYKGLGQTEKAVAFERKTLELYKTTYGEHHLAYAGSLAQLGDYLAASGDFEMALQTYQESSEIIASLLGPYHSSVAEVDRKMAGLYAMQGELEKALKIDLRVVSQHAFDFGENNPELGYLYHEIAEIYRKKGDFANALYYYATALRLRGEVHTSAERLDIACLLHDEGDAYISIGKYDSAESLLGRSLALQDSASTGNPSLRSSTYESLARVSRAERDFPGAMRLYQHALIALCPDFEDTSVASNPEIPNSAICRDYVRLLAGKAAVLIDRKWSAGSTLPNLKAALAAYTLASNAIMVLRNTYRAEDSKLALQAEGAAVYSAGMSVAVRIAQTTGDVGAKEAAFSFSERGKASILLAALQDASVRHIDGIPDALVKENTALQGELSSLLSRAEWVQRGSDMAASTSIRKVILEKNWRVQQIEDSLATLNPHFYQETHPGHLASSMEIQLALDSATCLVVYDIGRLSLHTFIVRRNSFDLYTQARPSNLDSIAGELRHSLKTLDNKTYIASARELYCDLIQPIEKYIVGVKRLVIIPDGSLYYLPFEVLLSSGVESGPGYSGKADFRKLPYLINRFAVSYAISATLFCEAQSTAESFNGRQLSFVGFAPASRGSFGNNALLALNEQGGAGNDGIESRVTTSYRYSALPYSASEVSSIARAFIASGREGLYITGSNATKAEFEAQTRNHSILHIATHGFIDEDHPDRSALLFAQASGRSTEVDGLLYAGDIYNLRLNADLVTLSSCESGVGKFVRGEGLMAMTRGFFYAGARNVLCSLWKVYDKQSNELMSGFYRGVLRGRNYPSALREAKLAMIRNAATAHPFKWAGFELIGE